MDRSTIAIKIYHTWIYNRGIGLIPQTDWIKILQWLLNTELHQYLYVTCRISTVIFIVLLVIVGPSLSISTICRTTSSSCLSAIWIYYGWRIWIDRTENSQINFRLTVTSSFFQHFALYPSNSWKNINRVSQYSLLIRIQNITSKVANNIKTENYHDQTQKFRFKPIHGL